MTFKEILDQEEEDRRINEEYDMTFNDMLVNYYLHEEEYDDELDYWDPEDPDDIYESSFPPNPKFQIKLNNEKHP